jgi:hypothetical protein
MAVQGLIHLKRIFQRDYASGVCAALCFLDPGLFPPSYYKSPFDIDDIQVTCAWEFMVSSPPAF